MSPGSTCSMPGMRESSSAAASTCSPEAPPGREPATARTSSGTWSVVCVAVSPSALSRPASSSRIGDGRLQAALVDKPRRRLAATDAMLGAPGEPLLAQAWRVDLLLLSRVASAATRAAAKPSVPSASMCSTRDCRRVENALIAAWGTWTSPAIPFHGVSPTRARPAGQLVPKLGLVEVAGRAVRALRSPHRRAPATHHPRCGSCWRRSRACAGAGPAPARCGDGTPPPRIPHRVRVRRMQQAAADHRRPPARGRRRPPAATRHAPR